MALYENAKDGKFFKLNVDIDLIGVFLNPFTCLLELKKFCRGCHKKIYLTH